MTGSVDVGEVELAYRIDGAGEETLVLVNGLADTKETWELQLGAFAERYRVVSYDNRGVGESSAPAGPYTTAAMAGISPVSSMRSSSSASTCSASRWAG